ncbi:DUF6447 family protein [Pseudomonadales bacterium]|jgi:hypothetical protein|nr:DUF6447 family protein [Pseudomonadales bacterium]
MQIQEMISIDGVDYDTDEFTKDQKLIVVAMNYCDTKIAETEQQLAALKTARQAYINDLGSQLKED